MFCSEEPVVIASHFSAFCLKGKNKQPMTNHLNLRHTLLEADYQGNLHIFSNGRSVHLPVDDVSLLTTWLSAEQSSVSPTQQIAQYHFRRNDGQVLIDALITIPAGEVRQISAWLRQQLQKKQMR